MTKPGNLFEYKPEAVRVVRNEAKGTEWSLPDDREHDSLPEESVPQQFIVLRVLVVLVTLVLIGRLFQMQVRAGSQYRSLAEGNSVRALRLLAERGIIFDANGKILARNTQKVTAVIELEQLPRDVAKQEPIWEKINQVIPIDATSKATVQELVAKHTAGEYILPNDLTKQQYLLLKELSSTVPAINLGQQTMRHYQSGDGLAHLLGYMSPVTDKDLQDPSYSRTDEVGRTGLELSYETELRGVPGIQTVEVDAAGHKVGDVSSDQNRPAAAGKSIQLAINTDWQTQIAAALRDAMAKRDILYPLAKNLGGTVIVMDPSNGQLRALVSLPDYDNNLFAQGITSAQLKSLYDDPSKPLFCRATGGLYPPGSTIKPLVATGALINKIVSPSYVVDTPAAITVGNFTFPDWKDHGPTDIRTAIAQSNNIFFYMLGGGWNGVTGLGLNRLQDTVHMYGFERPTGIDLPGEEKGYFLSADRKKKMANEPIYLGDVYHVSIGQGDIGVTPLQIATATAAVANGGTVYAPRLAAKYVDANDQNPTNIPATITSKIPATPDIMRIVQEGMRQSVVAGTTTPLNKLSAHLAGKTGTAQFGNNNLTHAWFSGYGPYEDPKYVVTVLIEGGGESFDAAVPLAEAVWRIIFNEPQPTP